MTMPRLSLYRPEKSQDYKFIDRSIYEMFQVGGVDVFVHKYIGPVDPSDPNKALGETTIQDVVWLENRDRRYATDIYTLRGHYQVQDIDFNLSQFGLFLQNDTVFMTIHINNSVDLLGRKIMSGDVLELPNLAEEYTIDTADLTNFQRAIKKYFVVEDVNRAAEGFSATWYPHLYRLKLKPIVDGQEYKDILERPADEDSYAGNWSEFEEDGTTPKTYFPGQVVKYNGTLYVVKTDGSIGSEGTTLEPPDPAAWDLYTDTTIQDIVSTFEKEMQINNAIILEAESDAAKSGFETSHLFTLAVDPLTGKTAVNSVDDAIDTVNSTLNVSSAMAEPIRDGYQGYLLEDGIAPNSDLSNVNQFGFGIQFPRNPTIGDSFLRTDYLPNRLFKYDGSRWVKQEDNVRMTLTNTDDRQTQKTSFINNTEFSGVGRIAGDVVTIDASGNAQFESGNTTTAFDILPSSNYGYIVTNVPFVDGRKVEVWLDEQSRATSINTSDVNGLLAFTINHELIADTKLRYTIFDRVVEQRQAVSKALRKFKPTADN